MNEKVKNIIILAIIAALAAIIVLTTTKNTKEDAPNKIVAVHVKGEVKKPGYYELSYGSRVKDAVDKAGGATENANLDNVNLAAKLRDGEEIQIPEKIVASSESTVDVEANASETKNSETETAEKSVSGAGEVVVNINTADMKTLCTLDGIGEATASAIVEYREEVGGFSKPEDLKKVKGIGSAKFDAIKDKIVV